MVKIKVSEASGAALNWLVAKCIANLVKDATLNGVPLHGWWVVGLYADANARIKLEHWIPSTKWSQGGPVMDHNNISTFHYESDEDGKSCEPGWCAFIHAERKSYGPTRLIAAMRYLVASKLGDEVEVPDELTQNSHVFAVT